MYKVTLIEGSNDICFSFDDEVSISTFMKNVFNRHLPRETERGTANLVIEIEREDDF